MVYVICYYLKIEKEYRQLKLDEMQQRINKSTGEKLGNELVKRFKQLYQKHPISAIATVDALQIIVGRSIAQTTTTVKNGYSQEMLELLEVSSKTDHG